MTRKGSLPRVSARRACARDGGGTAGAVRLRAVAGGGAGCRRRAVRIWGKMKAGVVPPSARRVAFEGRVTQAQREAAEQEEARQRRPEAMVAEGRHEKGPRARHSPRS